ncbi:MAG: hypothetical protein ABI831_23715 [Betaproteobacteria bacterium]
MYNQLAGKIITALAVATIIIGVPACQKPEGPMEKAGKSVDKAVAKAGDKIEEAGEKIQDAVKK